MKAIRVSRFGDPAVLEMRDVPALSPGPGQVVVRIHAAGVNPIETYIRAGKYPRLPELPYTPGSDGAGFVEQSSVPGLPEGTRVFVAASLTGTYAEQALCPAEEVFPLPDHISFEQGAGLGIPYGTATWALFYRGRNRGDKIVLVHGASGGVGLAAVQLAYARALRVFGTAGTEEGLKLVRESGAEAAFNHHEPDYLERIKAATGGAGVNLILEMAAHQNLGRDLALLAPRGKVVVIGSRGPVEIDARDLMRREADIRGVTLFSPTPELRAEIYAYIKAGLEDRSLNPVVGSIFPLEEAAQAHEQIMSSGARGKIVLTM